MANFIELAVAGRVEGDEIDDFVEEWHKSRDFIGPIFSFLGMTEEEYGAWMLDPDALPHIITAHRIGGHFKNTLEGVYEQRLAARADSADKLAIMQNWLVDNT